MSTSVVSQPALSYMSGEQKQRDGQPPGNSTTAPAPSGSCQPTTTVISRHRLVLSWGALVDDDTRPTDAAEGDNAESIAPTAYWAIQLARRKHTGPWIAIGTEDEHPKGCESYFDKEWLSLPATVQSTLAMTIPLTEYIEGEREAFAVAITEDVKFACEAAALCQSRLPSGTAAGFGYRLDQADQSSGLRAEDISVKKLGADGTRALINYLQHTHSPRGDGCRRTPKCIDPHGVVHERPGATRGSEVLYVVGRYTPDSYDRS